MGRHARYDIIMSNDAVLLVDVGPWDKHLTITNDAEWVVERVAPMLNGRRLFYIDSAGARGELLVKDGEFGLEFDRFAPAGRRQKI